MKRFLIPIILLGSLHLNAQTLFTYGNKKVSRQEFLQAYNKNGNGEQATEKDYRDYLELYINFKLKVQAALDKKMDTLPGQIAELQGFRNQIVETYLNDDSSMRSLVAEAFLRSQQDIHLAHILIPFPSENPQDTLIAYKRAMDAYNELTKGTDFGNVASIYSADTFALTRQGDIGYITVFTLPYLLENLAYSTAPGKFSRPYRTKTAYHIFKNIDQRKAVGKIKAAQIQLLFPPVATAERKARIKQQADSLYTALQKGASFAAMAEQFSNDNQTYQQGGEMPEFGVGTFDPAFERAAFALDKNGAISKPVLTSLGYHIIKRLALIPVNSNKDSAAAMDALKRQVLDDPARINIARVATVKKARKSTGLDRKSYDEARLLNYYRDHLEDFDPAFAEQMKEFKEGNLLFEIMQSRVWGKAAGDTAGLKRYYLAHQANYRWPPSADVIIFTGKDSATISSVRASVSINTNGWRDILKPYEETVQADSGRYELTQLPAQNPSSLRSGVITQPEQYPAAGGDWGFLFIKTLYSGNQPRSFDDAKGFVLNDYQAHLENAWLKGLKRKYPVKINEEVLKGLGSVTR